MLYTDGDKLRQILVNLMGNAVKFTDKGRISLAVERRNGEVCVQVRDTGIGIHDADRRRLFQPFTQLDAGLTRRHRGTGLGLYNSGRLAQLLGGHIEVDSAPGVGSTFTLCIPVRYSKLG
jgi:signal transduction histidine kinase